MCIQLESKIQIFYVLIIAMNQYSGSLEVEHFGRCQTGVGISPYVKNWEGENIPPRNSYSIRDIQKMLRLIATKFSKITTFGMGVTGKNM